MIRWFRHVPHYKEEVTLSERNDEASSVAANALIGLFDISLVLDRASAAHLAVTATAMAEIADWNVVYAVSHDDAVSEATLLKIEMLIDICADARASAEAHALTASGIRSLLGL